MRIALCLSGKLGNANKYVTGETNCDIAKIGYKHFKEHIIDYNKSVDVFIHSWDKEFKEEINSLYMPKGYMYQDQIEFPGDIRRFCIQSRWYSNKRVVDVANAYEEKYNFKYDFMILTRFDLALLAPIEFDTMQKDKFYHLGPDPIHKYCTWHSRHDENCCNPASSYYELMDLVFVSNSDNMKKFSRVYDHLREYGLDSNHCIARRHLEKINLFSKRAVFLEQRECRPCTRDDGDAPLVRWLYKEFGAKR